MTDKEKVLVDWAIEIDKELFTLLDKIIQADKEVLEEEMKLWVDVHLFPEKYSEGFVEFVKDFIKNPPSEFTYRKTWADRQLEKGFCTKCKEKASNKYYCEKHRTDLNRRRRIEYLEERFKKKHGIK
jgi:hypothetical protein